MAQYNSQATAAGIFKDVWKESVYDPFPFLTPIMSDLKLESGQEAGNLFHVPVMMQLEHGITYAPASSTPGASASNAYIKPRAGLIPDAKVQGVQTYGRSYIAYEAMMDTLNKLGESGDAVAKKRAVVGATKAVVGSLGKSLALRSEMLALHGGGAKGLGTISAVSTVQATSYEGVSGFAIDVRIDDDEWAPGLWPVLMGATLDIYSVAATGVKQNTAAHTAPSPIATTQTGLVLIDMQPTALLSGLTGSSEKVLRLWHSVNASGAAAAAVGTAIFLESGGPLSAGAREMLGIDTMARCGSGETGQPSVIHQLDSSTYTMWKGNNITGSGPTYLDKLLLHMATPFNFGVIGTKYRAVVAGKQFAQFAADEASLRRYDGAVKEAKNGFSRLTFTAQGGNEIEVLGHPFQKEGKITCYPVDEIHRVGSAELSFLKSTSSGMTLDIPDVAAQEIRAQGKFNLYAECHRHLLSINGVTY